MQKNIPVGESMNSSTKKIKIDCSDKIQLNIPQKIWSDIHYLHSKYPGEEWSGYIYFRPVGSIDNPTELILNIEEFVLMDLGTVGATEITPSGEQVVDMYEKRPQLIELKQALLHTHHNMSTFFSGTDWDTLLEHSSAYPYFLSLIVNTKGDAIAKVGLQGYIEEPVTNHTYKYKFGRGFLEKVIVKKQVTTEVIYVYDCNITIQNNIDEEFNKLVEIKKEKQFAKSLVTHIGGETFHTNKNKNFGWKQKTGVDDWEQPELSFDKVKRDTKGRTMDFIISCILQDVDCLYCESVTHTQAKSEWDTTVGIELVKEYATFVEEVSEDIFYNIFGENVTQQEIFDIKNHVAIIMGNHPSETAIKPIIKELLESMTVYAGKE